MAERKSQHEIIDFIANHYNLGNRAVTDVEGKQRCRYNTPEGKQCAFAIMCVEPEKLDEGYGAYMQLSTFGMGKLKPEFRGYNKWFYDELQKFHDEETYWNETGLSEAGKTRVTELKALYKEK